MAKKRKSKKTKRNGPSLGIFLVILAIFLALAFYSYKTNPEFRNKISQISLQIDERQTEEGHTEEKQAEEREGHAKIKQSEERQEAPKAKKLVSFQKNLERPLCAGLHGESDHQIRDFENYSICYRESYEQAEWSAYCLTEEQLVKNASRSNDFRSDPEILTASASLADYKGSGFDRGHLTPAADMSFSEEAMSETFFMSNMSPQAGSFNRGIWKDLESDVRLWAKKFGRVYVVSGPILEKPGAEYASIGENNVTVPEFYYKVILAPLYEDENDKKTPEDASGAVAIGFVFPNEKCTKNLFDYAVSIDEIEKRTKLDFFSLLDDEYENEIESKVRTEEFGYL
ncbi:MAG: DNA/RNA non-specific endonuclease [Treponema sp.]|nr:DNA/RNA non-specific endonuclease [Treponema sp.]